MQKITLKLTLFIALFFVSSDRLAGQTQSTQDSKYAALNIGVNGLIGALGAVVNKKTFRQILAYSM